MDDAGQHKQLQQDIESTDGLSHYDDDVDCQHFKVAVYHWSPVLCLWSSVGSIWLTLEPGFPGTPGNPGRPSFPGNPCLPGRPFWPLFPFSPGDKHPIRATDTMTWQW